MENKDMPAMPLALDVRVDEGGNQFCNDAYEGLTKREMIAMHLMSGLMSNTSSKIAFYARDARELAQMAVANTDALLNELEEN